MDFNKKERVPCSPNEIFKTYRTFSFPKIERLEQGYLIGWENINNRNIAKMHKAYDPHKEYWDRKSTESLNKNLHYWDQTSLEERKKYYQGFAYRKPQPMEKEMYKEELEDLEKIYIEKLKAAKETMEYINPSLVHYMKKFIETYEEECNMNSKLSNLRYKKTNLSEKDTCEDCE
jgi:hypothetical protein